MLPNIIKVAIRTCPTSLMVLAGLLLASTAGEASGSSCVNFVEARRSNERLGAAGVSSNNVLHLVPRQPSTACTPFQPLAPASDDLVQEHRKPLPVPCQAVVVAMDRDDTGQVGLLPGDWQMAMLRAGAAADTLSST